MSENALELSRKLRLAVSNDLPLKGGGGGGISDDMEARVKRLEDDAKELRSDLRALLIDSAVMKERVSHLPTKGWAFSVAAGIVAFMVAVAGLAPKIQILFGTAP